MPNLSLAEMLTGLTQQVESRQKIVNTLSSICVQGHYYHAQWKALTAVDPQLVDVMVVIVKRYEANGLQLNGLGIWLFDMISQYCWQDESVVEKMTQTSVIDILLRVGLEHRVHMTCFRIMRSIAKRKGVAEIFKIGMLIRKWGKN